MLLLSKEDIKQALTMKEAIEGNKLAYKLAAFGEAEVPQRMVIQAPEHDGSFVFMPAYASSVGAASVKVVNVFPRNIDQGLTTSSGQVLLCDGQTGYLLALLDGTYITQLRTGASTGAAFDLLAKSSCSKGGMIGTGGQAACQLEAMLCARPLKEVHIYDMDQKRCRDFCERMQKELAAYGVDFLPANSPEEAVADADLFVTVTPSKKPVFDGNKIKSGCTISCVGSYRPDMQECDPAVLTRASKIICDLKSAVLAESGDLLIPLRQGLIQESAISGSLGQVVAGSIAGRENDEEIIVYKTVGIGVQDLVIAKMAYDNAVQKGLGIVWEG